MSKEIALNQGYTAIVDDEDFNLLSGFKWRAKKNGNTVYAETLIPDRDGKMSVAQMHRMLCKSNAFVDHKDGNGLNNRKENLRAATPTQNQGNSRIAKNNTSGFKGVQKVSGRFRPVIYFKNKAIYMNLCETADEAAHLYNKAAIALFGEFARINPVGSDPREPESKPL